VGRETKEGVFHSPPSVENMRTHPHTSGPQGCILIYVERAALVKYSNDDDAGSDASDSTPRNVSLSSKIPVSSHPRVRSPSLPVCSRLWSLCVS
jgi:hypothetical protein